MDELELLLLGPTGRRESDAHRGQERSLSRHIVQDEKLISKVLINQRALTQLEKYALHFPLCPGIFGGRRLFHG